MKINKPFNYKVPILINSLDCYLTIAKQLKNLGFVWNGSGLDLKSYNILVVDYPIYLYCYSNKKVCYSNKLEVHDFNIDNKFKWEL